MFYAACVTMYRFTLLVSNSTIPQNMKRFKWHMLTLARAIVCGPDFLQLNSRQAELGAQKVIDVMGQHGQPATDVFLQIVAICQDLGEVTSDRLKRQAIMNEMLAML